jgi:hypothetical protein
MMIKVEVLSSLEKPDTHLFVSKIFFDVNHFCQKHFFEKTSDFLYLAVPKKKKIENIFRFNKVTNCEQKVAQYVQK